MEDQSSTKSADGIPQEIIPMKRRNDMGQLASTKPCYQCKGFTGYGPMKAFTNPQRSPFNFIAGVNIHSQSMENVEETEEKSLEESNPDLNIFLTIGDCIHDLVFIMALYTNEDDLCPSYFLCLKKTAYWSFLFLSEKNSESPSPDEWVLYSPKLFIQQDHNQVSLLDETAGLEHVVKTVVSHLLSVMSNDMYRHIFYPNDKPALPIIDLDEDNSSNNQQIDEQPINKRITRGIEGRKNIVYYSEEFSKLPKANIDMNAVNAKVKKVSKRKKTATATPKAKKLSVDKDSLNSNTVGLSTISCMTPASSQKGRKKLATHTSSSYKNTSYNQEYGNQIEDDECGIHKQSNNTQYSPRIHYQPPMQQYIQQSHNVPNSNIMEPYSQIDIEKIYGSSKKRCHDDQLLDIDVETKKEEVAHLKKLHELDVMTKTFEIFGNYNDRFFSSIRSIIPGDAINNNDKSKV